MFKNLDHRPSFIERLGLHLAVVATLTGLIGGALAIGGAGSVVAAAAAESQPQVPLIASTGEAREALLTVTAAPLR